MLIQIHYFWQMKNIFCVFLFLISFNAVAQKYADTSYYLVDSLSIDALSKEDVKLLDSCLRVYHASKQDTTRIKTLTFLIEEMVSNDWIKYQFYQYQELKVLNKNANKNIKDALQVDFASCLGNIGYAYYLKGKQDKALEFYIRSQEIYEEIGDKKGIASSLNSIGVNYTNQGDFTNAINFESLFYRIFF